MLNLRMLDIDRNAGRAEEPWHPSKVYPVISCHILATTPAGPIAFVDVRAFLDGTHFAEHQTVVVDKGR